MFDRGTFWMLILARFFLIKECIQILSTENYNFNYYRGQREGKWETIPSAFRNIINDNGSDYYLEFENIYKDIYKKFPEKIEYIEFPKNKSSNAYNDIIRKRGQQLSLLQHYELYTPLLDITSNPYIALLFMTNGELNEPQLEFYDISQSPLFMEPVKNQLNNRILAQKGAFLNYEMLLSKDKNGNTLNFYLIANIFTLKFIQIKHFLINHSYLHKKVFRDF